jgi:Putative zinc binding domain/C-methyltransferase C-terminal domain
MTRIAQRTTVGMAPMRRSGETARCRFCHAELTRTFVHLEKPPCETYLARDELNRMEPFYPLHFYVCDACWLVQLEHYVSPRNTQPDFVPILPWNLKEEVVQQLSHVRDWGDRFIVPIPEVSVD